MDTDNLPLWQRFRRNLSLSLGGAVVALGIKACQTLLLTRALSIDDYGRILIVINLFSFLNSFFGLRVSDLMFRFFTPFRDEQNKRAIQGLLLVSLAISLTTGVVIVCGVVLLAPWLAEQLCHNREFAPLFIIYGWTSFFLSLADVYAPILRIYDRFRTLIVPQVLGSLTTFAILAVYIASSDRHNLKIIMGAFAIGIVVQSGPPLVRSIELVKPFLSGLKLNAALHALTRYRSELKRCLFNSNMSGYLKIALSPGDVFILGIFSSPAHVALYGLAKQLIAPPALLVTNVQTALTPEVALLVAQRRILALKRLVRRYFRFVLVIGGLLTFVSMLAGRFLILRLAKMEYVAALPIFYVLLVTAWVLLFAAVFRPLALSFDLLKWDNLAHMATAIVLLCLIVTGRLDSWTMALVQLASALVLRLIFSLPVWRRLIMSASIYPEGVEISTR